MRKIVKIILTVVIAFSVLLIPQEDNMIAAKISGDFSYEVSSNGTAEITNYIGDDTELEIPDTLDGYKVTKIGYGAFSECKGLEKVIVPDTVVTFGNYAFSQCTKLKEIVIPDSVVSLGQNAFSGCNSLNNVRIPSNIKSIGYGTFYDCISLDNVIIPEGVESLSGMAFGGCRNLTNIQLPSTLTSLGGSSFSDCVRLEEIVIPEGVTTLGSSAFSGCINLKDIELPETITGIGQSAFQDCIGLEKIVLPNSVIAIGYSAFSGCSSLTEVNIPTSLSMLSNAVFSGCSSLKTIVIPNNVKSLGENVFSGCSSLESIEIPDSVTAIGQATFSDCGSLKYVKLSKSLKSIEINMFRYCYALENIVIPNSVTNIKATAFADCINLKSAVIPSTVITLGSRVFSNCPKVVLLVVEGSAAHTYALKEPLPFEFLGSGLNLDTQELSLKVGSQYTFNAVLYPYTIVENNRLTWTSSNPSIATVDNNGVVSALASGQVTITARTTNGIEDSCIVNVNDVQIPITSIKISKQSLTMKKDSSDSVIASVAPQNTTDSKKIEYTSSNTEVVTVSSTGKLTARKPGTSIITATSSNGMSATCEVTVISEIKSVTLNATSLNMEEGSEQSLRATINPSDTTDNKNLVWTSSNTKFATVDQDGNVKAIAKGTATITVTTSNGKKADCKVNVVEPAVDIPIVSVLLDREEIRIKKGQTDALIATINPSNTTDDKSLTWNSSASDIVSINQFGELEAKKVGVAVITVTTSNGKKANCTVTVYDVDFSELNQLIAQAEAIDASLYTKSSYEALIETVNVAKTLVENENVTQSEVDLSVLAISSALDNLVAKADVEELNQLIAQAEAVDSSMYTRTSYEALMEAVDAAKILLENEDVTQAEVDSAASNISSALDNLVVRADVEELNQLIAQAEAIDASMYTRSSYEALMEAVDAAKILLENEDVTQAEVDSAASNISSALDNLVARADINEINQLIALSEECKQMEENFDSEVFADMKDLLNDSDLLLTKEYDELSDYEVKDMLTKLIAEKDKLAIVDALNILKSTVQSAKEILKGDVSSIKPSKVKNLENIVEEIDLFIENGEYTIEEIHEQTTRLTEAIEGLEKIEDKEVLIEFISYISDLDESKYSKSTWNSFTEALEYANTVSNNPDASAEEVSNAYKNLVSAVSNLRKAIDKSGLKLEINMAKNILNNKSGYVASTIKGLDKLVEKAENVYNTEGVTQDEVTSITKELTKAVLKARKKPN